MAALEAALDELVASVAGIRSAAAAQLQELRAAALEMVQQQMRGVQGLQKSLAECLQDRYELQVSIPDLHKHSRSHHVPLSLRDPHTCTQTFRMVQTILHTAMSGQGQHCKRWTGSAVRSIESKAGCRIAKERKKERNKEILHLQVGRQIACRIATSVHSYMVSIAYLQTSFRNHLLQCPCPFPRIPSWTRTSFPDKDQY